MDSATASNGDLVMSYIRELTDPENAFWYGENHHGQLVADGVYHFVAEYCPKNLQPKKQVGFIHIFKNP